MSVGILAPFPRALPGEGPGEASARSPSSDFRGGDLGALPPFGVALVEVRPPLWSKLEAEAAVDALVED
eukprot:13244340-Alexandrium_andersonii.AAC.1